MSGDDSHREDLICYVCYAYGHNASHCCLVLREKGQVIANFERSPESARSRVPTVSYESAEARFTQTVPKPEKRPGDSIKASQKTNSGAIQAEEIMGRIYTPAILWKLSPVLQSKFSLVENGISRRERLAGGDRVVLTVEARAVSQTPGFGVRYVKQNYKVHAFVGSDRQRLARKLVALDTRATKLRPEVRCALASRPLPDI